MIIGITGTNGAGKGTVVEYLVQEKGFKHYSAREFILEETLRRGAPKNRDSLRDVANELRKMHGPAYVGEQLLARAKEAGGGALIESIRTVGEADFLKSHGVLIGAVDADRQIRYERVVIRGSMTDKVSFEEFCTQEDREMASIEPWDMNIFGVMKIADFTLLNNGTIEELHAQIDVLSLFQ
ncbi:AAA family ATPase [Patescibacteria group bacterium]|nr:AAA family ATPase [Patescibacteria group bacterium]